MAGEVVKPRSNVRPLDSSYHHPSHRHLLHRWPADSAPRAPVDAIVVPTSRPISWLDAAIDVARDLDAALVALCSQEVDAAQVISRAHSRHVDVLAVDVERGAHALPTFATTELLRGTAFERASDVSDKRNLALMLARMIGWQRVLFLDDDITDVRDAEAAVGLLDVSESGVIDRDRPSYTAVGLHNTGFADNSVVCHVRRKVGAVQDQFVGVGALAVAPAQTRSFFPDIYNDDWFFLIGDHQPPRIAVTGSMRQRDYDPFIDPGRARSEELGDCLAEGLYWLLDEKRSLAAADAKHWEAFLAGRRSLIDDLLTDLGKRGVGNGEWMRWEASLKEAWSACTDITPQLCSDYVAAWRADLDTWRRTISGLPRQAGMAVALEELGIAAKAECSWQL
jgi:hypothetical protein